MTSYVMLMRYTDRGVENIKKGPARLEESKKIFRTHGAELKQFYLVLGEYDGVILFDAPDDETAAKLSLAVCSLGNVRLETLRAFSEEEFKKLVSALP